MWNLPCKVTVQAFVYSWVSQLKLIWAAESRVSRKEWGLCFHPCNDQVRIQKNAGSMKSIICKASFFADLNSVTESMWGAHCKLALWPSMEPAPFPPCGEYFGVYCNPTPIPVTGYSLWRRKKGTAMGDLVWDALPKLYIWHVGIGGCEGKQALLELTLSPPIVLGCWPCWFSPNCHIWTISWPGESRGAPSVSSLSPCNSTQGTTTCLPHHHYMQRHQGAMLRQEVEMGGCKTASWPLLHWGIFLSFLYPSDSPKVWNVASQQSKTGYVGCTFYRRGWNYWHEMPIGTFVEVPSFYTLL